MLILKTKSHQKSSPKKQEILSHVIIKSGCFLVLNGRRGRALLVMICSMIMEALPTNHLSGGKNGAPPRYVYQGKNMLV